MNDYIKSFPKIVDSSASNMYARRDLHDGEVVPLPHVVKVNVPICVQSTTQRKLALCFVCCVSLSKE